MDIQKEHKALMEAFNAVYNNMEVLEEEDSIAAMRERAAKRRKQRYGNQGGGRDDFKSNAQKAQEREERMKKFLNKEEFDTFDIVLEYLVSEGFAETNENAIAIMANMSEEWKQDIMEISQKTATKAFARRATNEFETDGDNPRDFTKSGKSKADETKRRMEKKFGKKAGAHAERAAHRGIYGRKGAGGMPSAD
jgi:hypothetical protein